MFYEAARTFSVSASRHRMGPATRDSPIQRDIRRHSDTEPLPMRLDEISRRVTNGACAVLLLDRADWRTTEKLTIPKI
jgi:hypothetical protein